MAGPYTPPTLTNTPFPDLFSLVAQRNHHRPLIQIIREHANSPTDSIRFTWGQVIQHAQNAAQDIRNRWSERIMDKERTEPREPGSPPVVVAVMGNNGYELYVNVLACGLNRWTVLLVSSKNSPTAVEHLLKISNALLFLVDSTTNTFGQMAEKAVPGLTAQALATLDSCTTKVAFSPLKPITPEQLKKEMDIPVFILHTSGSTGHPKIVPWSHEFLLAGARTRLKDDADFIGLSYYCMTPLIHIMGVCAYFAFALAHGNLFTFVSSPTPKPPSAASLLSHLPFIEGGLVLLAPSILEDLYALGPNAVRKVVESIKFIMFGGAPLNVTTGNALVAAGMHFSTGWGATEIGQGTVHTAKKRPEDWEYLIFREGYTWHFISVDGNSYLKELIVGPGKDACPVVLNHDNPPGYTSNDLWEAHPTIPNLWKHHSRKEDITVLSNGEKSNNKQIEDILLRDKRILRVQVFGTGRPMNGVIIQPADPSVPKAMFLSQIGPTVDHANEMLPKHSRLIPELIIVAQGRPFATTDKGTVKRQETLDMFDREIRSAYAALEEGGTGMEWPFKGNVGNEEDLKVFVRDAVQTVLGKLVTDHGDLFEHGMDSLLAIRLRSAVVSVTKHASTSTPASAPPVPRNIVYTFPSIHELAVYLARATSGTSAIKGTNEERIHNSIKKFTSDIIPYQPGSQVGHRNAVALSGSTGSVGSSILGLLLDRDDIEKIYLLNRRANESQKIRQARGLTKRALNPKLLDSKEGTIVYLDVDFSEKCLGLSEQDYAELRDNVTHIIHTAWDLNFNLILESYERVHIAGVRHLIDLALSSTQSQSPRFVFLSTIAAAAMYQGQSEDCPIGDPAGQVLVPECPIDDTSIVLDQGYGQSKYVGERVIVAAVEAGLRATIIRIGQLSGETNNGAWATTEHVPIMLQSSLTLGMVPNDMPPVRWVPSDIAASAIVKQVFDDSSSLSYFSVENPFPTKWITVTQALSAVVSKPLQSVSLQTWLDHIKNSDHDPNKVPALRLLEFYQTFTQRVSPHACLGWAKSVTLAPELSAAFITPALVEKYVLYQQEQMVGQL